MNLEDDALMRAMFILTLLIGFSAYSSDYHSPRTASLGGAGHATALGNDSVYLNPAYTPFISATSVGLYWTNWNSNFGAYGRNYSVSIQDGRSDIFQAALSHTQRDDGRFIHVGASKSLIEKTGLGIGGKIYFPNNQNWTASDMTIAMTAVPIAWFQLAIVVDNVFESAYGRTINLTREWIFGTRTSVLGILTLYIDPIFLPSLNQTWGFESGAEFHVMTDLNLRLGLFNNAMIPMLARRDQGWSLGAGWTGPRISLDYAYLQTQTGANSHNFGATLYF
ncbi:MAG: hypothetical protein KA715_00480 [Xanthomonadaceae bacterium]|nr:hypothetical protein [Xanthomonadaceae bacterium]